MRKKRTEQIKENEGGQKAERILWIVKEKLMTA